MHRPLAVALGRAAVAASLLGLAACPGAIGPAPRPELLSTGQAGFWQRLTRLCGERHDGRMTEGDDSVFTRHRLSIQVGGCGEREVRIGFVIGPDSSRSWVVRRVDGGLSLRHEMSGGGGTDGRVSGYGGRTREPGSAARQDFVADAETGRLLPAAASNVWSLEIVPGRSLAYAVARPGAARRFRLEFDLRRPAAAPE
ncbi:MAG TPA: hypothetical protein VM890_04410 [Longimicrobium sp.]|nr:hypothetical protein [Longimicrobium sp.]